MLSETVLIIILYLIILMSCITLSVHLGLKKRYEDVALLQFCYQVSLT